MRTNVFVTFDPIFQELDAFLEHQTVAINIEDQSDRLFSFSLKNINVMNGRMYVSTIEAGLLSSLTNTLFDYNGKEEINYGVRIMNNGLIPSNRLISAFKENLPSGSRLFLVNKMDINPIIQHYINEYNSLTGANDRKSIFKRRRLYCDPHQTLTEQEIIDSTHSTLNFVDTYFSSINASAYDNFDTNAYLTGSTEVESDLKARVFVVP